LRFESYGSLFGIQLCKINESFRRGYSHAIVIGDSAVACRLGAIYKHNLVVVFVYCHSAVLKERTFANPVSQRGDRWDRVSRELATIYDELATVHFVVNNSGTAEDTYSQVDRILVEIGYQHMIASKDTEVATLG